MTGIVEMWREEHVLIRSRQAHNPIDFTTETPARLPHVEEVKVLDAVRVRGCAYSVTGPRALIECFTVGNGHVFKVYRGDLPLYILRDVIIETLTVLALLALNGYQVGGCVYYRIDLLSASYIEGCCIYVLLAMLKDVVAHRS